MINVQVSCWDSHDLLSELAKLTPKIPIMMHGMMTDDKGRVIQEYLVDGLTSEDELYISLKFNKTSV
jgi:hypothetical protein